MKIAVYAICKNEEKHVVRFLDSCKDADGIFILDTGSTDGTEASAVSWAARHAEIAQRLKWYVGTFNPWRFDVARNASLSMVPDDYDLCIALDLDEILPEGWRAAVEKVWRLGVHQVRYEFAWNHHADGTPDVRYWAQKMHSRHGWTWVKPVHEVLKWVPAEYAMSGPVVSVDCPILVHHWADDTKPRTSYLPLLELAVQEEPDDDRSAHYLAREYKNYGFPDKALAEFQRHLALPARFPAERAASYRYMAEIEEARGNTETQIKYLREAVKESHDTREPWVSLALALYNKAKDHPGAYAAAKAALAITVRPRIYISSEYAWGSIPHDILAVCAFVMGRYEEALEAGEEAARLAPTDARIQANLMHYRAAVAGVKPA